MGKRTTTSSKTNKKTPNVKDSAKIGVIQRGDTPIIEMAAKSDDSQILVTLRKVPAGGGSSAWLSPVGWSDVKKSTLLDCYENDNGCEIIIPDTYAKDLDAGDKLHVSCAALNVRGDVSWRAPELAPVVEPVSAVEKVVPTGLMSRFLSRNAPAAAEVIVPETAPSDALRRTEEAQKLADEYRVQMERAAAAREEAQQQALEAARRAEDALQAEADRITEMEKAAKAFAEAEASRQDEERRLEAERRAEELRIAEQARIAEEARQRELAIARAAERAEEKARLVALQEEASNQRAALAQHIETTRSALHRLSVDRKTQAEALANLTDNVADKETELSILAQDLNAQKGSLIALDERLVIAAARESDADSAQSQTALDVAAAERALEDAEAEVQAAMARAQQRKSEHESLLAEKAEIEQRAEKAARDLVAMREQRASTDAAVAKAQANYEAAQSASDGSRAKMDSLIHADAAMEQEQTAHKTELDRLAHDLDGALSRQDAAKAALLTLEEGGDVRAARQIMASVDAVPSVTAPANGAVELAGPKPANSGSATSPLEKTHKIRQIFSKKKAAALAVPAKILTLKEAAVVKAPAIVKEAASKSPSNIMAAQIAANNNHDNQNGSMRTAKFAAMGVGAIALSIALGLGMSSMTRPDVQKSVSVKPAPSKVLTAETRAADMPVSSIVKPQASVKSAPETVDSSKVAEAVIKPLPKPAPKAVVIKPAIKAVPVKAASVKVAVAVVPKNPNVNVNRLARRAARQDKADRRAANREAARVKAARVRAETIAVKPKPVVKTAAVTRSVPVIAKTSVPAIAAPVEAQNTAPVKNRPVMSAAVARDVQKNLQRLGYYTGAVDGVVKQDLRDAAQLFATVYDMPPSAGFNAAFVTRLSAVVREMDALQAAQPVQVASIAAPVSPVETSSLPIASSAPVPAAPRRQEAALTQSDTIVEAKLLKNMSIEYPSKAMRRKVYENVTVEVSYDIATDGTVTNARVYNIDYDGRFANAFEEEALQGVLAMQYSPKTVNGTPVAVTGQSKRVRFRIE